MKLKATFAESGQTFQVNMGESGQTFQVNMGEIQHLHEIEVVGGEPYEGEYRVTPKVTEQTLPTKNKAMLEDVVIEAIPYVEVTNVANGTTVTIG